MGRFLSSTEVLERMQRGDLPTRDGYSARFKDGEHATALTMRRLYMKGLIDYPVGISVDNPWTLR